MKLAVSTMERYEVIKDIGSGNFGVAKLARERRSGESYAIKFIEKGQKVTYLTSIIFHLSLTYDILCI